MREFLEDAHQHRDDGYGRAQKQMQVELPRRFYAAAGVSPVEGGFAVTLDGRATRTPGRVPIVVPNAMIAEAMAAEWRAQGETIDPRTMPFVRLVNATVEGGEAARAGMRDEIARYAATDLLLYRAEAPRELVMEQERHWDPALIALARHFSIAFQPTAGIIHQPQPESSRTRLASHLDPRPLFPIAAMASITNLTGSGLLAIGLDLGLLEVDSAWTAAHVDEDYNARLWGVDPEAQSRRTKRRLEYDAATQMLALAELG